MPGGNPFAVCGESADDGRSDLCSHPDEKFGDSAVYLLPVLNFLLYRLTLFETKSFTPRNKVFQVAKQKVSHRGTNSFKA